MEPLTDLLAPAVSVRAETPETLAPARGHVTTGDALDLESVGTEPGEHLGAGRPGLDTGEVDDLDPVRGSVVMMGSFRVESLWCYF